jgi:hypothetical protein
MASPQCNSDDGRQATFVGTFLQTGDAVALCDDCLAGFAASLTASMFGVPADELQALIAAHEDDDPAVQEPAPNEVAYPMQEPDPTPAAANEAAASSPTVPDAPVDADGAGEPPPEPETEAGQVAGE